MTKDDLAALLDAGMTQAEIARQLGVTRQTVAYYVKRYELVAEPAPRLSHKQYLPWTISNKHHHDSIARAIRYYSTREQGGELDRPAQLELARLLDFLDESGTVVTYSPDRGFYFLHRDDRIDDPKSIIRADPDAKPKRQSRRSR